MIDFQSILERVHLEGLSDTDLGREAGVDPSAIWRWRNGRRSPNLAKVNDVLAALSRLGFNAAPPELPVGVAQSDGRQVSSPLLAVRRPCSSFRKKP